MAGVGELDAVVKDGNAQGLALIPSASVSEHVQDRFPDSQERNRECVNPLTGLHRAGEEHMLLAEVDDGATEVLGNLSVGIED